GGNPVDSAIQPSVSGDGRFVVFTLLGDGTSGVFVRDRDLRTTTAVPHNGVGLDGKPITIDTARVGSISRDGCHVVFAGTFNRAGAVRVEVFAWDRCSQPQGPAAELSTVSARDAFDLDPITPSGGPFVAFPVISPVEGGSTFQLFLVDRDPDGNGVFQGPTAVVPMPASGRVLRGASSPALTDEAPGRPVQLLFVTDLD